MCAHSLLTIGEALTSNHSITVTRNGLNILTMCNPYHECSYDQSNGTLWEKPYQLMFYKNTVLGYRFILGH